MAADRPARISGLETHIATLSEQLSRMNYDVSIVFPRIDAPDLFANAIRAGVDVIELRKNKWSTLIRPRGTMIFHAHTYGASLFGLAMTRTIGTPVVMTVHGPAQQIPPILIDRRFADRRPFGIIYVSEELALINEGLRPPLHSNGRSAHDIPSATIENGVSLHRFYPPAKQPPGKSCDHLNLLYVGRVGPRKMSGVTNLEEVTKQMPGVRMEYAATWTPEGTCQATTDPTLLFQRADIVVSTGRGIREGMASGAACIVLGSHFDGIVTPENIANLQKYNFSGRATSTPPTTSTIKHAVKRLIDDPTLRNRLRSFGVVYAGEHFCAQAMARKTADFYNTILR